MYIVGLNLKVFDGPIALTARRISNADFEHQMHTGVRAALLELVLDGVGNRGSGDFATHGEKVKTPGRARTINPTGTAARSGRRAAGEPD
jgi:hypothetical protein